VAPEELAAPVVRVELAAPAALAEPVVPAEPVALVELVAPVTEIRTHPQYTLRSQRPSP
jgi:hypothetical protein